MNFFQNYLLKQTNNMIAKQDYELAEQFMNADFSFVQKKDFKIKQGCSAKSLVNLAKKKKL